MSEAPLQRDAAEATDEQLDPTDGIGRRVSAIRAQRGLGVSELARRVGVSPSLISQIERAQSRPSVSSLFAISRALEVPVDSFFTGEEAAADAAAPPAPAADAADSAADAADPADAPQVARFPGARDGPRVPSGDGGGGGDAAERYLVRRAERAAIDIEGGVRWERLTPETQQDMDFLELVYGPGAESHASQYRHPGTEAVMVLSGRLDIYVGFERYELGPGDSIHFPSSRPHRYVNPTDGETRAVTVIRHDDESA